MRQENAIAKQLADQVSSCDLPPEEEPDVSTDELERRPPMQNVDPRALAVERLASGVRLLVQEFKGLREECDNLSQQLEKRDRCIHDLEGRIRESNRQRQDAIKRIDDLLASINQVASTRLGEPAVKKD